MSAPTLGKPVGRKPRPKRPSTVRDMLLSLIVVGLAVGAFFILLPRSQHEKVRPVDYLPAARAVATDGRLPVYAPQPLPAGWQSNYARIGSSPDALHLGFVFDSDRFAQLDESAAPDVAFYEAANADPTKVSTDTGGVALPAGFTVLRDGSHVALLKKLTDGAVITISDGGKANGASLAEMAALARNLQLVAPASN